MAQQTVPPANNEKEKNNNSNTKNKLKTGEVKDKLSKGSTMVGRTEANPSGKPNQIYINPMQNESLLSQLNAIYDKVVAEAIDRSDTHLRDRGTTSLADIYKTDTPGQVVNAKFALQFKNPKNDKEAVSRSGDPDRKEMDIVRRNDANADRKTDSAYYRHQSIVKNVIDEKYGKGYVSPASKIEKAMKAKGIQPDSSDKYRQEMEKNSAAYHAIAKKKTTNEEILGCDIDDLTDEELGFTEELFISSGDELYEDWNELEEEAEYQGRKVKLGKPFLTPGGPKKRSVYVKNEGGNIVKVNFGDPNMTIKKNIPARRKSFRARHHCDTNPGPRTKARYWSCKAW